MTNETNQALEFEQAYQPELAAWVHWETGGFDVNVKYLSTVDAEKLLKSCQKMEWDSKTHQRVEVVNDELFKKRTADLIIDWKGLTLEVAKKFVAIKPGTPDGEFACNLKHKFFVITQFPGFASFIWEMAKNLHQEQEKELEGEIKN